MTKDKRGREIPAHLQPLLDAQTDERTREALEEALGAEGKRLKTGRWGRALEMSRFALGTGSRWLVEKARGAVSSEEEAEERKRKATQDLALQMIQTFSKMRGAAMKLGQMLSYLGDVLPPEAKKLLSVLQRDAPPMPWEQIRDQFFDAFGREPEEVFASFSHQPIASASIGQVHRATLHDGTPVAVKIQYPGIEEAMQADLKNGQFLGLFQQLIFFRTDTKAILRELEERFLDECNYLQEAAYQKEYARLLAGHPWIVVPEVHEEWTTKQILTTTYYEGKGFYEWLQSKPDAEVRDRVTRLFYRFYLGSFYLDGLFHCDPHPGNYSFLEDGRVVFFDYGCTRRFPEERRKLWVRMCRAVYRDKEEEMRELAYQVGFLKEGASCDWAAFRELMRYLYEPYLINEPFAFSRHKPHETFRKMFLDNPNLFKLNMPADAVFLNRIGFGLVSLLAEMETSLNCYEYAENYFVGTDPDWSEDPIFHLARSSPAF
jgi:predicted unusual protein kinase regulating ubiquinone biosynthesis (AarF/ABC1/UbiB family)